MKNFARLPLSFCLLLTLVACGRTGIEREWEDYRQRMQRVFDTPMPVVSAEREALAYPPRRALVVHPARQSIGLLEFLRLSHCDLNRLIAEHNSLLHRQQGLSERLFYDLEFIDSAELCLASASDPDREIYQKLLQARAQKIKEAPNSLRNALFAEREVANLFSAHSTLPNAEQLPIPTEIVQALEFFVAFAQSLEHQLYDVPDTTELSPQFTRQQFETHITALSRRKYAGELLLAMSTVRLYLAAVQEVVDQTLGDNRICRRDSNSGRVLINSTQRQALEYIFHHHFLEQLQPQLHQIQRGARAIHQWQALIEGLAPEPEDPLNQYWRRTWSDQQGSLWSDFQSAIRQHAAMWQRVLSQCEIMQLPPIE